MKVTTGFGETWLGSIGEQARSAEAAGFDGVTTAEVKHNSILALTVAAQHTERVELATGVTIAFPRSPMVMAQSAWDLQEFSGGRINIGLGSQAVRSGGRSIVILCTKLRLSSAVNSALPDPTLNRPPTLTPASSAAAAWAAIRPSHYLTYVPGRIVMRELVGVGYPSFVPLRDPAGPVR